MPMRRASVSWCTAWVMMLTGLVKLMSHARGARRDTSRPYSTIGGNRADCHREAGGADRLLSDGAEGDRRRLVPRALPGAA